MIMSITQAIRHCHDIPTVEQPTRRPRLRACYQKPETESLYWKMGIPKGFQFLFALLVQLVFWIPNSKGIRHPRQIRNDLHGEVVRVSFPAGDFLAHNQHSNEQQARIFTIPNAINPARPFMRGPTGNGWAGIASNAAWNGLNSNAPATRSNTCVKRVSG